MKRFIFITLLFYTAFFTFISYSTSKAYFASMAAASGNTFTAASEFPTTTPEATPTASVTPSITESPTPSPTPTGTLVINEFSSGGDNNSEWVEIYNGTGSTVDISGWKIADKNAFDAAEDDTIPTTPQIPAGGYAVIVTSSSIVTGIPGSATTIHLTNGTIGSGLNNNGDSIYLKNASNTIIDSLSFGSDTTIFSSPPAAPSAVQTLARTPNGFDSNTATNWTIDTSPTIGVGN
jgi:predicted extracellular nuclease